MSEAKACGRCGRIAWACGWARAWTSEPHGIIDPADAMVCMSIGYERERAAREKAEAERDHLRRVVEDRDKSIAIIEGVRDRYAAKLAQAGAARNAELEKSEAGSYEAEALARSLGLADRLPMKFVRQDGSVTHEVDSLGNPWRSALVEQIRAALAAAERRGLERAADVCDAIAQQHANAAEEHRVAAREFCGQRDEDKSRSSVYCSERIRAMAAEPEKKS